MTDCINGRLCHWQTVSITVCVNDRLCQRQMKPFLSKIVYGDIDEFGFYTSLQLFSLIEHDLFWATDTVYMSECVMRLVTSTFDIYIELPTWERFEGVLRPRNASRPILESWGPFSRRLYVWNTTVSHSDRRTFSRSRPSRPPPFLVTASAHIPPIRPCNQRHNQSSATENSAR